MIAGFIIIAISSVVEAVSGAEEWFLFYIYSYYVFMV